MRSEEAVRPSVPVAAVEGAWSDEGAPVDTGESARTGEAGPSSDAVGTGEGVGSGKATPPGRAAAAGAGMQAGDTAPSNGAMQATEGVPATLRLRLHMDQPGSSVELEWVPKRKRGEPAPSPDSSARGECHTDCLMQVAEGRYRVRLFEPGGRATERVLDLSRSEALSLSPPNRSARDVGLGLGIAGAAMTAVGLLLVTSAAMAQNSESESRHVGGIAVGGLGLLAAGIPMTAVGWPMFGRNRSVQVERNPLGEAPGPSGAAIPGATTASHGLGVSGVRMVAAGSTQRLF